MNVLRLVGIGTLAISAVGYAQSVVNFSSTGPNILTPGAPFQVERVTTTLRHLDDGGTLKREAHQIISRDADGRVFVDTFTPSGDTRHEYTLADPTTHQQIAWTSGSTTAHGNPIGASTRLQVSTLPPERTDSFFPRSKSAVTSEDLGARTISGVKATGTRTTTIVPADTVGNTQPLKQVNEVWVADDLQIVVAETDTSSVSGTRTVTVLSLDRTAPPADRFVKPVGLEVKSTLGSLGAAPRMP